MQQQDYALHNMQPTLWSSKSKKREDTYLNNYVILCNKFLNYYKENVKFSLDISEMEELICWMIHSGEEDHTNCALMIGKQQFILF